MTAMAPLALAAMGVGAGVSALGAIQAGNQQKAADQFNAQVQQQNAGIATSQANAQAAIDRIKTERELGGIAAAYGASGVDPNQGSPLEVLHDQAATGELTRQLDLYKGQVAAASGQTQAGLLTLQGQQAQDAGYLKAGATVLQTAGQAAYLSHLGSVTNPMPAGLGAGKVLSF